MIYIDPPYNTGNDFVYEDDFAESMADYAAHSGDYDEAGNRLVKNLDSNGRFHTDWLNMIYPRLKLARDLLTDDGAIFISIDFHEQPRLRLIMDDIFGASNFVADIACVNKPSGRSDDKYIATAHESILIYCKSSIFSIGGFSPEENIIKRYNKIDADGRLYREEDLRKRGTHDERRDRPNLFYPFFYCETTNDLIIGNNNDTTPNGYIRIEPKKSEGVDGTWRWGQDTAREQKQYIHPRYMPNKGQWSLFEWEYLDERGSVKPTSVWAFKDVNSERGTEMFCKTLGFNKSYFSNPKPVGTIERILRIATYDNDIILDFFSGSATTAHAVMQLNAEDGGKRKFIMVQLPEETEETSEAFKAGYKNICEIGKERIRRAGAKIKEGLRHDANTRLGDHKADDDQMILWSHGETKINEVTREDLTYSNENGEMKKRETHSPQAEKDRYYYNSDLLDTGFRVLKLDSTNMKPVYYTPDAYTPSLFDSLIDNIKDDRSAEDLLFQVMLDRGVLPSSKIEEKTIGGKRVFFVAGNYLVACFDADLDEATITAIAKTEPYYFVTRESSLATDSAKTNLEQLFKTYSPTTEWWVM